MFSDILISLWHVINRASHGYCRTKHSDTRRNGKQAPDGRSGPANWTITIASCPEVRGEPHHRFPMASGVKRERRGVAPETAGSRPSQPPFGGPTHWRQRDYHAGPRAAGFESDHWTTMRFARRFKRASASGTIPTTWDVSCTGWACGSGRLSRSFPKFSRLCDRPRRRGTVGARSLSGRGPGRPKRRRARVIGTI